MAEAVESKLCLEMLRLCDVESGFLMCGKNHDFGSENGDGKVLRKGY